jgi:hypothetical protein
MMCPRPGNQYGNIHIVLLLPAKSFVDVRPLKTLVIIARRTGANNNVKIKLAGLMRAK